MSENLILGPPGCGKTHTLIEIVKKELERGVSPDRIGFVSFSKKAIEEAKSRTVSELNLSLDNVPWFRTLHSIGFQWLGMNTDQILSRYDFNQLGLELGMLFDQGTATSMEDGLLPTSVKEGNKYIETIGKATLRCVSLEQQYNENRDYYMSWPLLVKVNEIYQKYKKKNDKFDFTDMIKLFVEQGTSPNLEVLIVDEAQDLTPLQWEQIKIMRGSAKKVWYAGDDDQAVHRWMGVKVEQFITMCDNTEVLQQSYRVPMLVHHVADKIVKRIDDRLPKTWFPTKEEGKIDYHMHWYNVNMDQGSWTIMARTNRIIRGIANELREDGYLFDYRGRPSINPELLEGVEVWNSLVKGESIPISAIKDLYRFAPKQGTNAVVKRLRYFSHEPWTFSFKGYSWNCCCKYVTR